MSRNNRRTGAEYETFAASFLIENGLDIIEKNFRCNIGEIDIIANDRGTLCFIEVKYRSGDSFGLATEAVNYRKQQKIRKVAQYYINYKHFFNCPCRFDVVGIDKDQITYIKNAF